MPDGFRAAYRLVAKKRRLFRLARRFRLWTDDDQRRLEFYRQFVTKGALVFDVGANIGNRAKVFARLGATVVAVEPQADCADFLDSAFRAVPNFRLVRKALGASVGRAELLVSEVDTLSSLSPEWVQSTKASGRFRNCTWNRTEWVQVDTLDGLISEYGRPDFVKIDVEGFEDQVLAGLSAPVAALSMEFTPEFIAGTWRCIGHLGRIGNFQYQLSLGESMTFSLSSWVTADELPKVLEGISPTDFGDLYARSVPRTLG